MTMFFITSIHQLAVWCSTIYRLYIGPGVVMILDDDAQAGVVCARLIDIQGWLPLLCGY